MSALLRLSAWLLAVALVLLPVIAVLEGWIGADRWPLQTLRVHGTFERIDEAKLRETLLPYAQAGFFAVELREAQDEVAALPWVERAEVRKRWPDVLEVTVVEHRPFARWGKDQLLSDHGRLFPAAGIEVPAGLPALSGPAERVADVVALYNESRALFAPTGLDVEQVVLDARGSWTLALTGGAHVLVGRQDARERLARFARIAPRLLGNADQPLARVDLRYTNGFAIAWATPAPEGQA